jgi:hypothetical protein
MGIKHPRPLAEVTLVRLGAKHNRQDSEEGEWHKQM